MCGMSTVTGKLASGCPNGRNCSGAPYWNEGPVLPDLLTIEEKPEIRTLLAVKPVKNPEEKRYLS